MIGERHHRLGRHRAESVRFPIRLRCGSAIAEAGGGSLDQKCVTSGGGDTGFQRRELIVVAAITGSITGIGNDLCERAGTLIAETSFCLALGGVR